MTKLTNMVSPSLLLAGLMVFSAYGEVPAQLKNKALDFPLHRVVSRFQYLYDIADEQARLTEQELKKYLILIALNPETRIGLFSQNVDNLWHTFITFTEDYEQFCQEVAGRFIHHMPDYDVEDPAITQAAFADFVELYKKTFDEEPTDLVWAPARACGGGTKPKA